MSREALIQYWAVFEERQTESTVHAVALEIQSLTESAINDLAAGFDWFDPRRQTIRQALRWAKDATTQEVEDAIMEASR